MSQCFSTYGFPTGVRCWIVGALSIAASFAAATAVAQSKPAADAASYPDRPVRVVVPYAPGGSSDAVARILSQKLTAVSYTHLTLPTSDLV